jgi:hypothetical protein
MKFFIVQFSPPSCSCLLPGLQHIPQHPSQTLSSCVPPITIQQERAFKMHIKNGQCTGCQMSFIRVPTSVVQLGTTFTLC